MIKLFVSDIDGCIATPYQSYQLDKISALRTMVEAGGRPGSNPEMPAFSVLSGRSYPYVEAVSQVLGIKNPIVFESGAGLFDPISAQCEMHPKVGPELVSQITGVKQYLREFVSGSEMLIDMAKETQAAVVAPRQDLIQSVYPEIRQFVSDTYPSLLVFQTPYSIDIVVPELTKKEGLKWLASKCEVEVSEMAFIGDTEGDGGALQIAGRSYAPANADDSVKQIVDYIAEQSEIDGVLEAYEDAARFIS